MNLKSKRIRKKQKLLKVHFSVTKDNWIVNNEKGGFIFNFQ